MARKLAAILLALALAAPPPFFAWAEAAAPEVPAPSFRLPASLQIIGDSAFEGTAAATVALPPSLLTVGARAFAATPTLTDIYIPASVESIDDTAFLQCAALTIHAPADSYAARWAKERGVPFMPSGAGAVGAAERRARPELCGRADGPAGSFGERGPQPHGRYEAERSVRPPRERAELHPIDYRFP